MCDVATNRKVNLQRRTEITSKLTDWKGEFYLTTVQIWDQSKLWPALSLETDDTRTSAVLVFPPLMSAELLIGHSYASVKKHYTRIVKQFNLTSEWTSGPGAAFCCAECKFVLPDSVMSQEQNHHCHVFQVFRKKWSNLLIHTGERHFRDGIMVLQCESSLMFVCFWAEFLCILLCSPCCCMTCHAGVKYKLKKILR